VCNVYILLNNYIIVYKSYNKLKVIYKINISYYKKYIKKKEKVNNIIKRLS
jgi:hypothetical protein